MSAALALRLDPCVPRGCAEFVLSRACLALALSPDLRGRAALALSSPPERLRSPRRVPS